MHKKADFMNIWSRYLKGTPAQEIYTRYKKALSEESRAMQFSQKMEFYLMAKDDDELMAAIACFTLPQMDTVLRGLHKIICNDPTIVADMKNVHQEEIMNAFLKKTVRNRPAKARPQKDKRHPTQNRVPHFVMQSFPE